MNSYAPLLDLWRDQPAVMASSIVGVLFVALALCVSGSWLPLLWMERPKSEDKSGTSDLLMLVVLGLCGGMVSLVLFGTLSSLIVKQLLPGVVFTVLAGIVTSIRLAFCFKGRVRSPCIGVLPGTLVTVAALLIGIWVHGVSEMPCVIEGEPSLAYTAVNDDTGFHVYLAAMIEQSGLPLRDMYGSPQHQFAPLTHTGHGVLIGSLSLLTGRSLFQTAGALWIVTVLLIAWSGLAVFRGREAPGWLVVLGSLSPLLIGPVDNPNLAPLSTPIDAMNQWPLVSARLYWNLPQALSTAFVAVSLLVILRKEDESPDPSLRVKTLLIATLLLVVSGLIKPSLFIFYAPALLLTLLLHRSGWKVLVVTSCLLMLGVILYASPLLLATLPGTPGWEIQPTAQQTREVVRFVLYGCSPAILLALWPLRDLARSLWVTQPIRPLNVALLAMGGSLLFAVLFRELQFVDRRVFQPNIWWGPSACLTLLIPWLVRDAWQTIKSGGWARWLTWLGLACLVMQMVNGVLFCVACPAIRVRYEPMSIVETLESARDATPDDTRFLIDPELDRLDLAGRFGRAALYDTVFMDPADRKNLDSWKRMFTDDVELPASPTGDASQGWSEYDAAVISVDATQAESELQKLGWDRTELSHGFQLWRHP